MPEGFVGSVKLERKGCHTSVCYSRTLTCCNPSAAERDKKEFDLFVLRIPQDACRACPPSSRVQGLPTKCKAFKRFVYCFMAGDGRELYACASSSHPKWRLKPMVNTPKLAVSIAVKIMVEASLCLQGKRTSVTERLGQMMS